MLERRPGFRNSSIFYSPGGVPPQIPARRVAEVRSKRLNAGRGFDGNIEIKLGLFVFEMDGIIRLDLNGPERIGSRGEVVGEIDYENQRSEEEQDTSGAGHRFQVKLPGCEPAISWMIWRPQ